ncbi:MAG: hypothetical protein QM804_19440 [Propionicimonas sp.]
MGNDLEWRALFADVTRALPRGTELIGFDLVTGANPTDDTDPATRLA